MKSQPLPLNIIVEKTEEALYLENNLNIEFNPKIHYAFDAGYDVRAAIRKPITIFAKTYQIIPIGLKFQLTSPFWEIQVRSRSGLAAKNGVFVLNSPGTVDYNYREEVKVILYNAGNRDFVVSPGDRIAQICIRSVPEVNFILGKVVTTDRGGFGSSGIS